MNFRTVKTSSRQATFQTVKPSLTGVFTLHLPGKNCFSNPQKNTFLAETSLPQIQGTRKEKDKSMNRDDRSYHLSHIRDNLFTVVTSSAERKSFRAWQKRLSKCQKVSNQRF